MVRAENPHWLDSWLPRVSHFSQFGLFAATIAGFYFTVLPLYQKAVLEEAIARKEVALAESERSLQASYFRLRGLILNEFVRGAVLNCGTSRRLPTLEGEALPLRTVDDEIVNSGGCIRDLLQVSQELKELREVDRKVLAASVGRASSAIEAKWLVARREFLSVSERAKLDPSILSPPGYFSGRMLSTLAKVQPGPWIEDARRRAAIQETERKVAREYQTYALSQIASLRSLAWEPASP